MNSTALRTPAAADVGCSGPDHGLMLAVIGTADTLRERLDAALVAVGLSFSKFDAIQQLSIAKDALTLGDLAGRLHCVRSNVTQLVDRLEAEGLVKRGSCPEDRRAIRAKLTPLGLERHAAGVAAVRAVQAELAERLDAGERTKMMALLSALRG